ncbi:SPFH domain-containing protein [Ileibacterium valens]|uniref:Peptidase n=1 Tax=Ileibacterium valens TaxID=1862668 RepID=A0A1U7NG53_9FIRM|nr:SPFH domain-containing protein [Ileibacterium valens]OLU38873.1 peptidase [Erysipelotrichaceae bacterium NYU-BL-F16]OLU39866.1 peptidase [Ileibacterium valens]OLU43295.1 peptidase [Erysipelotrichaceae bacterium NYU-BL-E8]
MLSALTPIIVIAVILVILAAILLDCVRIVPQAHAYVVQRLGAYLATWTVGLHIKVPFIDSIANKVDLKEQVADFPPQAVITKDNVTMHIDTVIFYQVTDPKLYTYGVENPLNAIENLTATTLRNIIGEMDLDKTLTSRDDINTKMRATLDDATDPWGIKINRVELKNIMPPKTIQEAMEKQMKAERERREKILRAEGEKESTILVAEGQNQAAVSRAQASKQAMIEEAYGKAEAIRSIQKATAEGLKYLQEANLDETVLRLKAIEAFSTAADGKATKLIIPSDIQSMVGLTASLTEAGKFASQKQEQAAPAVSPNLTKSQIKK